MSERRSASGPVLTRTDATRRTIHGYGAVFNQRAEIAGLFEEQLAPGAFREVIGRDDVRGLFNHDPNYLLGRTASGTMTLREDRHGLHYEIAAPTTTAGRDVVDMLERGDLRGSSFSFEVDDESWEYPANGLPLRTIRRVKRLFDVGPVSFPAYEQTSAHVRAAGPAGDEMSREWSRWRLAVAASEPPEPHETVARSRARLARVTARK